VTKDKPLAGKRILVLEDDFYLADDEKALLVEAGAEVVGPFGSASQPGALAAIQGSTALLSTSTSGAGRTSALRPRLRELGVPFAFVTGYDAAVIPDELSDAPRIEKPIRSRNFIATIAQLVERRFGSSS